MPRTLLAAPLLVFSLALAWAVSALAPESRAAIGTVRVALALQFPVYVTAPAGDHRLFIVERRGVIKILRDGQVLPTPFLDIDSLVMDISLSPETGLSGLAFHPDFPDSPYAFVFYVNNANETVMARYEVPSSNANVADHQSAQIYLQYPHPYNFHYGGHLAFGLDRYLYVSMGDGGHQGDPENRAQSGDSLYGKILRLDVLHPPPYTIPSDNPFVADAVFADEIWAYGFRNPYRFSFDRETGARWYGDVGQDRYEEIDVESGLSVGGLNFGWPIMEADSCFRPPTDCHPEQFVGPVFFYSHQIGCAIVGGNVYRGSLVPELQGQYFCGDFCAGRIWSMDSMAVVTERTAELGGATAINRITAFGEDGFGELYIVDYGFGSTGEIYKIVDPTFVGAEAAAAPGELRFRGPSPNPARSEVRFSLALGRPGTLDVTVLDVAGREVARVASGRRDPGIHSFAWRGETRNGRRAAAGTYLLRAALDGRVSTRSVVYLP